MKVITKCLNLDHSKKIVIPFSAGVGPFVKQKHSFLTYDNEL